MNNIFCRLTIGIKLLRDLGWKEGQGIGPRVKRKVKRKVKPPTGQKIYGCALPREQEKEVHNYAQYLSNMLAIIPVTK